ncbi:MAG: Gfo/Idh/MocA family oxidoreductase [Chloroflexi bacterium]|nr:Gfo/Idh/MocA family oxidoreductase [Chloroflexota bacterium]
MKTYRAVVIGCGRIGSLFSTQALRPGVHSHAQAYAEHPRTELVGVCDNSPVRLRLALRQWHTDGDTDALRLIQKHRPDIVSICTPDESHFPLARAVVQAGGVRCLLVEKPLALSAREAGDLVRLCRRRQVALAVNYLRRFSPAFRQIRREIKAGRHGRLMLAHFVYGSGLVHNGSHALDLLRFLFGEPAELRMVSAHSESDGVAGYDAELCYAEGGRAVLTSFPATVATVFEGDFLCEKSRWQFALGGTVWKFFRKKPALYPGYSNYVETPRRRSPALFEEPLKFCLLNAVDNIVRHLDGGEPLLCTGEDGWAVLRQTEKLLASA